MNENSPKESLSLEWGRFRAGARGYFAIVVLLLIFSLVVATYVFGFWRVTAVVLAHVANGQTGVV